MLPFFFKPNSNSIFFPLRISSLLVSSLFLQGFFFLQIMFIAIKLLFRKYRPMKAIKSFITQSNLDLFSFNILPRIKARASWILDKHSTTELYPEEHLNTVFSAAIRLSIHNTIFRLLLFPFYSIKNIFSYNMSWLWFLLPHLLQYPPYLHSRLNWQFFSGANVWRRIKKNKNRQNGTGPNKQTDRQKMSQRKNTDRLTDTMFTHRNPIKNTKPERTCKVKRRKRRRKRKEKEPQQNITR